MDQKSEDIEVVPEEEGWEPSDYKQPAEDEVVVENEHPHPLEMDMTPGKEA